MEKCRKLNPSELEQYILSHFLPVSEFEVDWTSGELETSCENTVGYFDELCEEDAELDFDCFVHAAKPSVGMPVGNSFSLDRSFAEMLQFWINEKDMKPSEFYNAANLHRSSYNNIINHPNVVPKKNTALACVIGLRLTLEEAEDLLKRAGYCFSDSQLTDVIVRCYMENNIYDINEINEVLYEKDLALLGSAMN